MKLIILSLICNIFVTLFVTEVSAQKWSRIGILAGSVILNGIGDGMNDEGKHKVLAHSFKAASVGMSLVCPLIAKTEKKSIVKYISTFVLVRYALFDVSYNMSRGLPYDYNGTSSIHDNILRRQPKALVTGSKFVSLGLSIYINNKY